MEEDKTWRKCPFEEGKLYIVKEKIDSMSETFYKNEKLEYVRSYYSIYDSYTGYIFSSDGHTKILDIHDSENIEDYTNSLKEL